MYDSQFVVGSGGVVETSRQFTYDAAEAGDRRKAPKITYGSEDTLLPTKKRDRVTANARDINRNFSTAAWAIRRHLDYVASFSFHGRAEASHESFNDTLEAWLKRVSARGVFDLAGRHRLGRFMRLAELRRCLDGDFGVLRLAGGQVQAIEGDRIRNPPENIQGNWTHGVKLNPAGRSLAYALHRRVGRGLEFETTVAASNLFLHASYDRFDQVRGIAPITAALNQFRDVYENLDYALAKAKVAQLFALAFYREADESAGVVSQYTGDVDGDGPATDAAETGNKYAVDFGRGPAMLDLEPGDRAEFLESKHPSTETQAFFKVVTMIALKSLDIPYSFFDESHTNFFGSRGAWLHYDRSCDEKRRDLTELLNWWTQWRLQVAVLTGELELPRGWTVADIAYEWVPEGMPWWDPAKEIRGDTMAVEAGFDNPQRIVKERGRGDYRDNIDQTAQALAYARSKGVILSFDAVAQSHLKTGGTLDTIPGVSNDGNPSP